MALVRLDAVILWSRDVARVVAFYRAIGVPIEVEDHGDGVRHHAADFQGVHFAILDASAPGDARRRGEDGAVQVSFKVDDLGAVLDSLRALSAKIVIDRQPGPWGIRVVLEDPDGRPIQLTQDA